MQKGTKCFLRFQKEKFVNQVPLVLSKIGEVLQSVNRELLLILKANDQLRGIEHTLKVHKRYNLFIGYLAQRVLNLLKIIYD